MSTALALVALSFTYVGAVWFLEMNCSPLVHPDLYPAMLASAFRQRTRPRHDLAVPDFQPA